MSKKIEVEHIIWSQSKVNSEVDEIRDAVIACVDCVKVSEWIVNQSGVYACPTCGRVWSRQARKANETKEPLTETEKYTRAIQAEINKSDKHLHNFLEFGEIVKAGINLRLRPYYMFYFYLLTHLTNLLKHRAEVGSAVCALISIALYTLCFNC